MGNDYSKIEEQKAELENKISSLRSEISRLESNLSQSRNRQLELQEELKIAKQRSAEHDDRAQMSHQRSSELENLFQKCQSKVEEASKKANKMELSLKAEKHRIEKLEEQISNLDKKCEDAESKSKKYSDKVSQLVYELEAFQARAAGLEASQKMAIEKERELTESLNSAIEEKKILQDTLTGYTAKLADSEKILEVLRNELNVSQEKIESKKNDLKAAKLRQSEAMEKIISAEKRLEEKGRLLEEVTTRNSELELLQQSLVKDFDSKLKEAIQRFTQRDIEASELSGKIIALEGKIKLYEEQAQEASNVFDTQKTKLEETLLKLSRLQGTMDGLQNKAAHFETENGELAEANLKLTQDLAAYETKLRGLKAEVHATLAEKDEMYEQLQTSKKAIEDLTQKLTSERQRLESQISSAIEEKNQLSETNQNAIKELQYVILELEGQLKEQKIIEDSLKYEIGTLKAEVDEKNSLQTHLTKLEQHFVIVETQLKEEVEKVKAAAAAREAEFISKLEDYANKVNDRDALNQQVLQLQKELQLSQNVISQQKQQDSEKDQEGDKALRHSLEQLKAKNKEVELLDKQVQELKQKLQLSQAKEKSDGDGKSELKEGTDVKSRDLGLNFSTPSKRKSKKKLQAAQTSTSAETPHQDTNISAALTFKFIIGVALVSVAVGIILGKRY